MVVPFMKKLENRLQSSSLKIWVVRLTLEHAFGQYFEGFM
jgi:hypothetical protein